MFFDGFKQLKSLAATAETAIFAIDAPDDFENEATGVGIRPFYILEPDDKGKIGVEAVRDLISACNLKMTKSAYVVIKHAETLREEAENALLKLLEEPKDNYHFLIFTKNPTALLPTIRSRAEIYYPVEQNPLEKPLEIGAKERGIAENLLNATPDELSKLADTLSKKKDDARAYTLTVLAAAVELAYKDYFNRRDAKNLKKLPGLLAAYENIKANGNIKLQIFANLI